MGGGREGGWSKSQEHFDGLAATLAEKVSIAGLEGPCEPHFRSAPQCSEGPGSMLVLMLKRLFSSVKA